MSRDERDVELRKVLEEQWRDLMRKELELIGEQTIEVRNSGCGTICSPCCKWSH